MKRNGLSKRGKVHEHHVVMLTIELDIVDRTTCLCAAHGSCYPILTNIIVIFKPWLTVQK